MRLLDRYVLRELLIPFGYCLGGFLIFWIAFDLFSELDNFQKHQLTTLEIARYYLIRTPEFMIFPMVPASWLLALLYALTNHARHHELTAMRAAGVSLWRLAAPYLVLAVLLSLGLFALNECWVPQAVERANALVETRQPRGQPAARSAWEKKVGFLNSRDHRTWMIEAFNTDTHEMLGPNVEWTKPSGEHVTLWAERAHWRNGFWVLTNVQQFVYPPGQGAIPLPEEQDVLELPEFRERPEEFESEIKISRIESLKEIRQAQLSILEILQYKKLHRVNAAKQAMLDTKLHGRLAAPWTCVVIVLMALPFGAATGRRNVFVGVASSIVICFVYFVMLQLALALGSGGLVPPWLAAWSPNLFFGLGGIGLTWRVR
jgi:LPS export ABC transporter permease LptG